MSTTDDTDIVTDSVVTDLHVEDVPDDELPSKFQPSTEDTPPKTRVFPSKPKSSTKKKAVPKTKPGQLVNPLAEIYVTIGTVLRPFDEPCADAIITNGEKCAEKLDELAQQNDGVRRALLAITQTNSWAGVMAAHLPIIMVITAHHSPVMKGMLSEYEDDNGERSADPYAA